MKAKTHTHTTRVDNEEIYYQGAEMFGQFVAVLARIYSGTKHHQIKELQFEKVPTATREGPALDCGIVYGPDFIIKKTDLYGNNPIYHYTDKECSVFISQNYLATSTAKVNKKSLINVYNIMLEEVAEERSYLAKAKETLEKTYLEQRELIEKKK